MFSSYSNLFSFVGFVAERMLNRFGCEYRLLSWIDVRAKVDLSNQIRHSYVWFLLWRLSCCFHHMAVFFSAFLLYDASLLIYARQFSCTQLLKKGDTCLFMMRINPLTKVIKQQQNTELVLVLATISRNLGLRAKLIIQLTASCMDLCSPFLSLLIFTPSLLIHGLFISLTKVS